MANTAAQLIVEVWVRETWMPREFGQRFTAQRMLLTSGGFYNFDAVSDDCSVIANLSTCALRTASGKQGIGKIMKVRSDAFFLLLTEATRRVLLLTDAGMHAWWLTEQRNGRLPAPIDVRLVDLPPELRATLTAAQDTSSREVSPHRL